MQNRDNRIRAYLTFFKTASYALSFDEFELFINANFQDGVPFDGITKPTFIRVKPTFLLDEQIFELEPELYVFFLDYSQQVDEAIWQRVQLLRQKGFQIALFLTNTPAITTLPAVDYWLCTIDTYLQLDSLSHSQHACVVLEITTQEQFDAVLKQSHEATLLCGTFFESPTTQSHSPFFSDALTLLNVLEAQEDINKLANAFQEYPNIIYALLRYLNSSHFSFNKEITSIKHALLMMGRLQLRRWLLLIALDHALGEIPQKESILFHSHVRLALMKSLLQLIERDTTFDEEALFAALLSTLEKSVGISLQTVISTITINDELKSALTLFQGKIGNLLALIIAIEECNLEQSIALARQLHIDVAALQEVIYRHEQ